MPEELCPAVVAGHVDRLRDPGEDSGVVVFVVVVVVVLDVERGVRLKEREKGKRVSSSREIKKEILSPFSAAPALAGSRRVPGLSDEPGNDPVEERVVVVLEPAGCVEIFFLGGRG